MVVVTRLHDPLPFVAAVREPPYRTVDELSVDERDVLEAKLGDVRNYNPVVLRELARSDARFFAAVLGPLLSAEFRGVDFIGRFTVEHRELPWNMTMGFARQAWDEARHIQLDTQLLEHYGSYLGEYPDRDFFPQAEGVKPETVDPAVLLAVIHLALEGFALSFFDETRAVARETGQDLLDRCHDYNAADEITHVALGDYWQRELVDRTPSIQEAAWIAQQFAEANFDDDVRAADELANASAGG
jgi:uncharacterized ferritin-like protein (DUF455 family)